MHGFIKSIISEVILNSKKNEIYVMRLVWPSGWESSIRKPCLSQLASISAQHTSVHTP